jgi:hypothetical protein
VQQHQQLRLWLQLAQATAASGSSSSTPEQAATGEEDDIDDLLAILGV